MINEAELKIIAVLILGAVAIGVLLAALEEVMWASPGPGGREYSQPEGPYLAPWEVSALLEEARKIAREASGDDPV
jgi:hypothetical protein